LFALWGEVMGFAFKLKQYIGDDVSIDREVGVTKLVDISSVILSGSSFGEIRNTVTGEHYRVLLRFVSRSAIDGIYTNNPQYIEIGTGGIASQATPQITELEYESGWLYRTRRYKIPNSSNVNVLNTINWGQTGMTGENYSYQPTVDMRYIFVSYTVSSGAFAGEYFGVIFDTGTRSSETVLFVQKEALSESSQPLPVEPAKGGGGYGSRDNTTDVNVELGIKSSNFLSGILGTGFNLYFIPTYHDLIKAAYYSLNGIIHLTDWVNNTAALFLNPASFIVSAVALPCNYSIFSPGSFHNTMRMGGIVDYYVDNYPLGKIWGDTEEFIFDLTDKPMYYDSYLDFEPFTKMSLLLPYIGCVPLKASECNGGIISVMYRFEALTGRCVALIKTTDRNGRKTGYYQYPGYAGFNLPWIGNNGGGSQMLHSTANTALNISRMNAEFNDFKAKASASKTGMSLASAETANKFGVAGAELGLAEEAGKFVTQDSRPHEMGSFGTNMGALGSDEIVLIIQRAQQAYPDRFYEINGYQTVSGGKISKYSGYTRFSYVELTDCEATQPEQTEIVELLKRGVYL